MMITLEIQAITIDEEKLWSSLSSLLWLNFGERRKYELHVFMKMRCVGVNMKSGNLMTRKSESVGLF